jgi:hypothetical protein
MRLALAECTEAEIATITGHSLRDVYSILEAHYLHAIQRWPRARLESSKREQNLPTDRPTGPGCSNCDWRKAERNQWWAHKDSNLGPAD